MELTNEIVKKGVSGIPGYRLEYSVTYREDKVVTITAQIRKLAEADGVKSERYVGQASLDFPANRLSVGITDYNSVSADERAAIVADFEKTIKALS